jgi:hypothetical protein
MISRRIAENLKAHNWFAVAIDFVSVVVGVFIGLQVQDWSTAREARTRGRAYSARLVDDLSYEAWNYEYLLAYYKDVRENAARVLAAMTGGPALSEEQFLISAYRATQYIFNERRRATYDEMIATGDIGLIADQRLRETAFSVYTNPAIDVVALGAETKYSEYRRIFRRVAPADIQHALLERCGDRYVEPGDFTHIAGSINYDCALDFPTDKIAAASTALRNDRDFLPALQLRFADLETTISNLETLNPVLRSNLQAITQERAP